MSSPHIAYTARADATMSETKPNELVDIYQLAIRRFEEKEGGLRPAPDDAEGRSDDISATGILPRQG
jgi:hypothetical protein